MNAVIDAIRTILAANISGYTILAHGEMLVPAQSELPIIEIIPLSTIHTLQGSNNLRQDTFNIRVQAKITIKDYVKNDTTRTKLEHMEALEKIFEERNADGTLKTTTILGAIENDLTLGSTVQNIVNEREIVYDESVQDGSWIAKAFMNIQAQRFIPISC